VRALSHLPKHTEAGKKMRRRNLRVCLGSRLEVGQSLLQPTRPNVFFGFHRRYQPLMEAGTWGCGINRRLNRLVLDDVPFLGIMPPTQGTTLVIGRL